MKMKHKIIATAVLLLGGLHCILAQDNALAAISKIAKAYNSTAAVHFTGQMKMYAKNNPSKIIDRLQGSYTINNKNFHCSIGPVSLLLNEDYYVSADKSSKVITIGRKKDLRAMTNATVVNFEQLKKWVMEKRIVAVVANKANSTQLQLTDTDGSTGFNTYTIEYNNTSGYMKKAVLETAAVGEAGTRMVLEIVYTEPVAAYNTAFSETSYFTMINHQVHLSPAYKTYQIISRP
jgi:hypothetical protein